MFTDRLSDKKKRFRLYIRIVYELVVTHLCVCLSSHPPPRCLDRSEPKFACHISVGPPLRIRNI